MIRTEGLTHIQLTVRDLERSLRFYQTAFGMEELFREGAGMLFLRTPGARDTITLTAESPEDRVAGTSGGIAHFGFRRRDEDLDAAISAIEAAGGGLVERGEHSDGHAYAYVTDPDGYVIEI